MADIQFDEEQEFSRPSFSESASAEHQPILVRLVLKTGLVTDPKIAEYVLLGIAIVAFIVSIVIVTSAGTPPQKTGPVEPEAFRIQREASMRR